MSWFGLGGKKRSTSNARDLVEEEREKQQRELKKLMEWNNKCPQCNINYCKCDTPNFIINYNKKICSCCKKRKYI